MDSRLWHNRLRGDLRQQGLPPLYIDRLVEELADHIADSQTEDTSMEAHQAYERLGTTEQLAATAGQEFRRRTFAGRYPVLTFIFGPVAFVPVLFVLLTVALFGLLWAIGSAVEFAAGEISDPTMPEWAHWAYWIVWGLNGLFIRVIPFAVAAYIFCRWGQRSSMRRWSLVACGIVAVMAALLVSKLKPGTWQIGLGSPFNAHQLLQIITPLAIGGWFLWRAPKCLLPASTAANSSLPATSQPV